MVIQVEKNTVIEKSIHNILLLFDYSAWMFWKVPFKLIDLIPHYILPSKR